MQISQCSWHISNHSMLYQSEFKCYWDMTKKQFSHYNQIL
jgi:hypothetical protein